jgi:hypothetical protein
METAPGPPGHEKYYVDVTRPEHAGLHYVTCRSDRMQKCRFNVMCPGPPEHEK